MKRGKGGVHYVVGCRWRLGLVFFEPFDALALLWNLFSCRSISFAPVRGGSHFLCTGMPLALALGVF